MLWHCDIMRRGSLRSWLIDDLWWTVDTRANLWHHRLDRDSDKIKHFREYLIWTPGITVSLDLLLTRVWVMIAFLNFSLGGYDWPVEILTRSSLAKIDTCHYLVRERGVMGIPSAVTTGTCNWNGHRPSRHSQSYPRPGVSQTRSGGQIELSRVWEAAFIPSPVSWEWQWPG